MDLKDTYDKIAEDWHADHNSDDWWQEGTDAFVSLLSPGAHILNVGCGAGHKVKYLTARGFKVTGVDFSENLLAIGTTVTVDQHDEFISFGGGLDEITFLPHFFDLESSLGSDLPTTTVTLTYDPEEAEALGIDEENLAGYLFNEALNVWEKLQSLLNAEANTISFITPHFSRYAIGAEEPPTIEELFDQFRETLETGDIDKYLKKKLQRGITKVEEVLRDGREEKASKEVHKLKETIRKGVKKDEIDSDTASQLLTILEEISVLIPPDDEDDGPEEDDDRDDEGENKEKGGKKEKGDDEGKDEEEGKTGKGEGSEEDKEQVVDKIKTRIYKKYLPSFLIQRRGW